MLTSEHVVSLVKAHASGDSRRFYTVAMGMAASLAREGNGVGARKVRDAVDNAQSMGDLPAYSGLGKACDKCRTANVCMRYLREGERNFLERECQGCGYVWYERCADADE